MARCRSGKQRFRDELSARIALARLVWNDTGQSRVYKCNLCGGFHLTSQEQRTEKAGQ